jgi:hypothetical protein
MNYELILQRKVGCCSELPSTNGSRILKVHSTGTRMEALNSFIRLHRAAGTGVVIIRGRFVRLQLRVKHCAVILRICDFPVCVYNGSCRNLFFY